MAKNNKKKSVLSSGKVKNSYGFIIPTRGIDTKRFSSNPVMLKNHYNSTDSVIGRWEDFEKDLTQDTLLANPVFDTDKADAAEIAGQVERGFLKGISIGINFMRENLVLIGGIPTLKKCELIEASIVAIPSNSSSLILYCDGKKLEEKEAEQLCLSLQESGQNFETNNTEMDKIKLAITAMMVLGFTEQKELTAQEMEAAILKIGNERDAMQLKLDAFEAKETARVEKENATMVDNAIKAGKITADKREAFMKLAAKDHELCKTTLEGIPGKKNFSQGLGGQNGESEMKMEDFQKLSLSEQLSYKADNPEGYKKMLQAN